MEKQQVVAENMETSDSKTYEVSYILLPNFSQDEVISKVASMKEKLTSFGAVIVSDEDPILIDLAYPMTRVVQTIRHKADKGYFGWVKFEVLGDSIEKVKKYFDDNADILRHLIIKTVKENTLLNGKMKLKSEDKGKKSDEVFEDQDGIDLVKEEINEEEVDKSIDELVTA